MVDLIHEGKFFFTPYYTSFSYSRDKKPIAGSVLEKNYNTYLLLRSAFEKLGIIGNDTKMKFEIPESIRGTRPVRAIPLYSENYLNFLQK